MFIVFIVILVIAGCSDNKAAPVPRQAQAAPVFVSKAVLKSVPIEIQAIGNVEAYSTVTVKAQIGGGLNIGEFEEGGDGRKSEPLVVIHPRPCESPEAQGHATLAK